MLWQQRSTIDPAFVPTSGNKDGAQAVCVQQVKARLVAPGTAQFQAVTHTDLGGNRWRIAGAVDADNSFGAPTRYSYTCTVSWAEANYKVESLELHPP